MSSPASSLHVLFVVNAYPPSVGGVQQHVWGLATNLVARGVAATVVCLADADDSVDSDTVKEGVRVIRRRRSWGFGTVMAFPRRSLVRELRAMFGHEPPTCISTHTRFFPMTWLGDRLARILGVPRIHTEHGSDFVSGVSPLIALASRVVDMTRGRRTLRRADRVLGVSPAVVAFVRRLAGVDADVFYNAITPPPARLVRRRRASRPRLVFLGRLVPGKGWPLVVRVAEALTARGRPVAVDFLGDGPERGALEAEVAETRITATIHGFVDHDSMWEVLAQGVLINPSTLSEGFQTSLLEALAVGATVVSSPVPGTDVLASDGAPVAIVADPSVEAWTAAAEHIMANPPPPYPAAKMARWLWPARAGEYAEMVERIATR